MNPLLIFIHIPKCGGTTLGHLFAEWIGVDHMHHWDKRPIAEAQRQPENIRVLMGHFPYGLHEHYPDRYCQYVAFFRDPVERFISHYYGVLRSPNHRLYKYASQMTIEEYATCGVEAELDNPATRLMAGRTIYGKQGRAVDAADLALARERLRSLHVIGIMESESDNAYHESVDRVRVLLRTSQRYVPRMNAGGNKQPVSDEAREAIRAHDRYDLALYVAASHDFVARRGERESVV